MNLHEYQSKEILAKYGVAIQRGFVANNVDEAVAAAENLLLKPGARLGCKSTNSRRWSW